VIITTDRSARFRGFKIMECCCDGCR